MNNTRLCHFQGVRLSFEIVTTKCTKGNILSLNTIWWHDHVCSKRIAFCIKPQLERGVLFSKQHRIQFR